MVVQEIINLARYSELANTALGKDTTDNTSIIVSFLNMGMIELYTRFTLKEEEHIITRVAGTTMYDLPADFMYPMSAFKEVDETSEDQDEEIAINDEEDTNSIFFPNHKQVQIPSSVEGNQVSIIYVAKPEKYTATSLQAEVDLPEVLVDCLLHYIGYKAHLGMRGDAQAENNAHYMRFERAVMKAKELGVTPSRDSYRMPTRIGDRGFV